MIENQELVKINQILDSVCDPEIPVLTVRDLGIIRDLKRHADGTVEVVITPTYSGCPAMHTIEINLRAALQDGGFEKVRITTVLSPAWTTEWLSAEGRQKLSAYGIAPPAENSMDKKAARRATGAGMPLVPFPKHGNDFPIRFHGLQGVV